MNKTLKIFEQNRSRLRSLGYRLLGSVADTDDLLQELFIRWHRADADNVRSPDAWLTTVMTRLCLDRMRQRKLERDGYPGMWLPEPLCIAEPFSPDATVDLADDLSLALLVVLERLSPDERATFLLHDVFEHEYADIGVILGKTQASCRQLLHRARKRIRDDRPRFQVSQETRRRLLLRFLEATRSSDREALVNVLAEEATLISDSGGRVRATLKVIYGSDRIARLLIGLARKRLNSLDKLMRINGEFGIVTYVGSRPVSVLCCEVDEHRITQLYRLLNPDKLRAVPPLADAPIAQMAANNAGMLA